ncbi:MAG: hypothetical protein ACD_2C00069G0003 [uncultured bacterium (gcode 4)]|uniref:SUF system FeS cluster assembly SufBD core domain-containing protein n=1 Tax=uncultured bacterium (gcode 4) TaxID=1234023 RepID=K2GHN3_9BACT|nr:MAG: hypothetical protein ACD_2C00069G0003 [uncultured bacterium (gcode 4)]
MEKINDLFLESWFYRIEKSSSYDISISPWSDVVIFDDCPEASDMRITLWESSNLKYFWFSKNAKKTLKIKQDHANSNCSLAILNLVKGCRADNKSSSIISGNGSSSRISILSIIWENGDIRNDSSITVTSWTQKWIASLTQENILIWDSAKVSWVPALYVHTDDASATHSLKIEKIKWEDLFYLTSRWIDNSSASAIMLSSKIFSLFSEFAGNKDFLFEELDNFLKK